jgi:co-chaperonin GroES (HSP10)
MDEVVSIKTAEPFEFKKAKTLPQPAGYHILCAIPEVEKVHESGILKADTTLRNDEILATVLFVLKIGPTAYMDVKRFPNGPWCAEGDFIIVRPNTGTRIKIFGKEFRLINDDQVEAVVEDPRGITRAA